MMEKNYLSSLIDAGSDAFSNLFNITIEGDNSGVSYETRLNNFSTPNISQATVDISYQNTKIKIPMPALSGLDKTTQLSFRIDENYNLYNWIRNNIEINDDSSGFSPVKHKYNISVEAKDSFGNSKYKWTFYDCRFITLSSITYTYEGASVLTAQASFTWRDFKGELSNG